jgi:nucleotide-binding universal stress UspA family protein
MIPQIQRILYTTDLSENSRAALDYTVSLAEKFNAQIIVLHVMELISVNTQVLIQ